MPSMEALVGRHLLEHADELAWAIVQRQYAHDPSLPARGCAEQPRKDTRESRALIEHLAQAMLVEAPLLFDDYATWCRDVNAARQLHARPLDDHLRTADAVFRDLLAPQYYSLAAPYLASALQALQQPPQNVLDHTESSPRRSLAVPYLHALLAGQRTRARDLLLNAVAVNAPVAQLYLQVFQPALREIGRLWQANRISTAQEHYASAATQWIMSQLDSYLPRSKHRGRNFLCTCVGGETHAIGLRMVCDFLDMDGWQTYYLGADTPADSIISEAVQRRADVVGISAAMLIHLDSVASLIRALRREPALPNLRIMVGGRPFLLAPELHQRLGADATATDAQEAVANANALFEQE